MARPLFVRLEEGYVEKIFDGAFDGVKHLLIWQRSGFFVNTIDVLLRDSDVLDVETRICVERPVRYSDDDGWITIGTDVSCAVIDGDRVEVG